MQPSVFDLLTQQIRSGLKELGITEPTPPQEKVMKPLLKGENLLLIAPTASGKTEAALLPVFDMLLRSKPSSGISIIYITPLRALNRDIHKRLTFWSDKLDIKVEIRHGDTSQKQRRRQTRKPPNLLVTTPETLQAILPTKSMRPHLESVRWVIIDEIHDLAGSKRGAQLTLGLERLEGIAPGFQRIGLSATVGNPEAVAGFLAGGKDVTVIEVDVDKS
jgi:ATP-dependent Lhr-like helicase